MATLTASQMSAAPLISFTPSTGNYGSTVTSYANGTITTEYWFQGTYRKPGIGDTAINPDIYKFKGVAGDFYSVSRVWAGIPAVYDSAGNPIPANAVVAPGRSVFFTLSRNDDYYVAAQFNAADPNVQYDSVILSQTHTQSLQSFLSAGPRSGDATGTAGSDSLQGTNLTSRAVWGLGGNDSLSAQNGVLVGGDGMDTAFYTNTRSFYTITKDSLGVTIVTDQAFNKTALVGVERLWFSDATVAVDSDGSGGQAYRLYQAAFDRTPDKAGLGFHIRSLDAGASLQAVAQGFVASYEFSAKYGSLANTDFVTQLYANVLHRAPDAGGLAYHTQNLANGMSRAAVLPIFSESAENKAALIGVINGGMEYA